MDYERIQSLAVEFIMGIAAVGSAIAAMRAKKHQSDTEAVVEHAKQASVAVYIEQLEATQEALTRERQDRVADAVATRAREAELRTINDEVRKQFSASLDEFRTTLARRDERIGALIEDVAEYRGRLDALQSQVVDLQAAIASQKAQDAEARRAVTAAYERQVATLKAEVANLNDRNRALVNQLYGDGTATNIMGPHE